jgi:hypothetical protein
LLYTLISPGDTTGYFGNWVSGVGDVDNDGYDDVIVGAWYEDGGSVDDGRAYVFSGQTGAVLHALVSPNEQAAGHFGTHVSGAGDVDLDGIPDVVVGAPFEKVGADVEAGRAYIFSGATGALLYPLISPNVETGGWYGVVSGAGDVDRDGYADVIAGATYEADGASRAYVYSGQTGALVCTLESPNEQYMGHFGIAVSGAGDVNSDGCDDVIVGASGEDPGGSPTGAGRAYVFDFPITSAPDGGVAIPSLLSLRGPFPNPTDGSVRLAIQVLGSAPGHADLSLYGVSGRRIATVLVGTVQDAQSLTVSWTPHKKLSPGVYYWRLTAGAESVQRPMVLAK